MTWPTTDVDNTNVDASGDDPDLARADLKDLIDKFNDVRAFLDAFVSGLAFSASTANTAATSGLTEGAGYATTDFNIGSAFNATTGRFTAPVAGLYHFDYTFQLTDTGSGKAANGLIRKNGSSPNLAGTKQCTPAASSMQSDQIVGAGVTLRLAASDYVSVFTQATTGSPNARVITFSGAIVGP